MSITQIRLEQPGDQEAIRAIVTAAFQRPDEADLVEALHEERAVLASFVASRAGTVTGHILFTRMFIENGEASTPAVALAPLAVHPAHQREGIGGALIRYGLDRLREKGESIVIVLGHPAYYPRFGFSARAAEAISSPFHRESFMALELVPGALHGVSGGVRYARSFRV